MKKKEQKLNNKSEINVSDCSQNKDLYCSKGGADRNKSSVIRDSGCSRSNRKKIIKVEWTPELQKKFVKAVEQLGVDQAIPSRILKMMKVEGLTRNNVASHLQKYRTHRKHILPKEDDRRWPNLRGTTPWSYYPHNRPVMAFPPPYHSNHIPTPNHLYPPWLPTCSYPIGLHMWGSHYCPGYQPVENSHRRPYTGMHADAWGCPEMPPAPGLCTPFPQNAYEYSGAIQTRGSMLQNLFDQIQPAEEIIDKVVKEAMSKPWLPLPLGLKPPSTDTVLNELSKQGISIIPSHSKRPHLC